MSKQEELLNMYDKGYFRGSINTFRTLIEITGEVGKTVVTLQTLQLFLDKLITHQQNASYTEKTKN